MASCKERTLEATSTWAVAVVFFVLIAISIVIEQLIHYIGTWLKKKRKAALYEALEKIKSELMLLGFISFLLAVFQDTLSNICVSRNVGHSWFPCEDMYNYNNGTYAGKYYYDTCVPKGKVQLISAYGIHQLHIFIFALALTHVVYCVLTYGLGKLKMRQWSFWEDETNTVQYQSYNDPERFRYARDTSFGQRHLHFWSKSPILPWIVCFFRQFFSSVAKVDYMTLRHGFVTAHLPPQSQSSFDFQKYIDRSLEDDFKYVVGISPVIWFCAVLFLLTNTNGWYSHYWLPFIPLIILLVVGTKLQVIITKMGRKILERGDIVKGTPIVEPGDHLFWFNSPGFVLFLIAFVLFSNAFQLAFLVFSLCAFGYPSCFHQNVEDVTIRVVMGVLIHILCSYVTLPLYALVIQMGSTMKPVIFSEQVASAIGDWKDTAKKQTKQGRRTANNSPLSGRPASPLRVVEGGYQVLSPRVSNLNGGGGGGQGTSASPGHRGKNGADQHEVEITLSDFSNFGQKDNK